ncbi:hypothetical protein C8R48DRAFT_673367 [Suillus tomentosus]|nr:hypothetical protein C8R48DRAFT_673367 [Suillus tomentosus]
MFPLRMRLPGPWNNRALPHLHCPSSLNRPDVSVWHAALSDEQQALLRPFSATIRFPDLDLAVRRRRWLQLFGRDDLAQTISSDKHASVPTMGDTVALTFLREIEKISVRTRW